MHGSILLLLKRYVTHTYDFAMWHRLIEMAGLPEVDFDLHHVYPDTHIYRLVGAAAKHVGIPAEELQEKFGEFLVPDLLFMYRKLVDPTWHTLEFLEHVETQMHRAVRQDMPGAHPPILEIERLTPDKLRLRYISQRKMGGLAVGILRGVIKYYGEEKELIVRPITQENQDHVEIMVERVDR